MGFVSFLESVMDNFNYNDDYRLACEDIEAWQKGIDAHILPIPDIDMFKRRIGKDKKWRKKIQTIIYLSACLNFANFDKFALEIVKTYDLKNKGEKEFNEIFALKDGYLKRNARKLYDSY